MREAELKASQPRAGVCPVQWGEQEHPEVTVVEFTLLFREVSGPCFSMPGLRCLASTEYAKHLFHCCLLTPICQLEADLA